MLYYLFNILTNTTNYYQYINIIPFLFLKAYCDIIIEYRYYKRGGGGLL